MHKKSSPAFHILESTQKVPVKEFSLKTGKEETVRKRYRFSTCMLGKKNDTTDVITQNIAEIRRTLGKKVSINPKAQKIGGVPFRAKFHSYPIEPFSQKEIGCHRLHHWATAIKTPEGLKLKTQMCYEGDNTLSPKVKAHPLFAPMEIHPLPEGWIIKEGETNCIQLPKLSRKEELTLLKETFSTQAGNCRITEELGLSTKELFQKFFPLWRNRKGSQTGYTCGTHRLPGKSQNTLYRLLYYIGKLNIQDPYKGGLCTLRLGDTGCAAQIYFYKYELAVELWCPTDACILDRKPRQRLEIHCGVPGSKNPGTPQPPQEAKEMLKLLSKILSTKTPVYSGNNFFV